MSEINSYEDYKRCISELFQNIKTLNKKWEEVKEKGYCISKDVKINNIDILIIGINPSFPKGSKEGNMEYKTFDENILNPEKGYWSTIKSYVQPLREKGYRAEHLDLFAIRKTEEQFLKSLKDCEQEVWNFMIQQLSYAQDLIELIHPKLIVVANKAAWAYFGRHPKYVWMGYEFRDIFVNVERNMSLAEIVGIRKYEPARINKSLTETNLIGTKVLFARYQAYCCPKEQKITSQDLLNILESK